MTNVLDFQTDEIINLHGCPIHWVIIPREALFYDNVQSARRHVEGCNATNTFIKACHFENKCVFNVTKFRNESEHCYTRGHGAFSYDCISGNDLSSYSKVNLSSYSKLQAYAFIYISSHFA